MRGIHLSDAVATSIGGSGMSIRIKVDTREFNQALDKAQEDIKKAIWYGIGKALSDAKIDTYNYLRQSPEPLAKRVADSLDYEREVEINGNNVEGYAMFGSRGETPRGELGVGVYTEPDDDGGTYPIGFALQYGRPAHWFSWKAPGASQHGRQIGTKYGNSAWYGRGGGAFFYGFPALDYLGHAMAVTERRLEGRINGEMNRRL